MFERRRGLALATVVCATFVVELAVRTRPATPQPVEGSGAAGEVAVWASASKIGGDPRLVWNPTKHRLGIGVASPADQLHLSGNLRLPPMKVHLGVAEAGALNVGSSRFLHSFGPADAGNTFLGLDAGNFTMAGIGSEAKYNTGIGRSTLSANTTGADNTAVGWHSLVLNTTGGRNVAVGGRALAASSTATENTAVGRASLRSDTTGSQNTAVGADSLVQNTTANKNTAVGAYALYTQSYSNAGTPFDSRNTAIGYGTLYANQPAAEDPEHHFIPGVDNTAVGFGALGDNTSGSMNVGVGLGSLWLNTTGSFNTDIGGGLTFNSTGWGNTAVGGSLLENETGSNNTAVGLLALCFNQHGGFNAAVGYMAGGYSQGDGNVFLGPWAGGMVESISNRLYIANRVSETLIFGEFDTGRVGINDNEAPTVALDVNGEIRSNTLVAGTVCASAAGVLRPCTSDARLKKNVASLSEGMDVLEAARRLRAVSFDWDESVERARGLGEGREVGLMAQEVETVLPEAVRMTPDGYRALDYSALTAFLVEVARAQQSEIEALKARLAEVEGRVAGRTPR